MVFMVSPSVSVEEKDLSVIIPNVATSTAATAGQFQWGPVEQITLIDNEDALVNIFGKPTNTVYKDFMVASSFLAYAGNLKVVRVVDDTNAKNATCTATATGTGVLIKNQALYDGTDFSASTNLFAAKYPGTIGNSIGVAWCDATGYSAVDTNGALTFPFHDIFTGAPGTNEFHVVVYDYDGTLTGTAGTALEKFEYVSTVAGARSLDGTTAYFKTKINNESAWIWVVKDSLLAGTKTGIKLGGGVDGNAISVADRERGFGLFVDSEQVDVSIVFAGGGNSTVGKWIIDNIAEVRKDCVALVSVDDDDVVNITNAATMLTNIKSTRTLYGSSSYAIMDSAYKYMYDRYNDVNRWVPLNGDIAGLLARTDEESEPWFSPAGLTRGRLKNTIKLSSEQSKAVRDELYRNGINPCVVFPIDGPVLYGDKTLQSKPSAFDRINVRRLFIVLEKSISTSAKYMLFEQNDEVTRARFVNMVEPFLRDVKGRRGITEFKVVCDETNNPGSVIDRNEFVADIYIKPTRAINFVKLNFVAVASSVSFDEVVQTA